MCGMSNVTLSVPDSILRSGREYARRRNVSLNALIRKLLTATVVKKQRSDWVEECFSLMDKAKGTSKKKKWRREDLYDV